VPTVWVVQHHPVETPGLLGDVLRDAGVDVRTFRVFEDPALPDAPDGVDGLVVMGGPMGVGDQDRLPHLREEIRLLREAVARELPVLGICLGSQLLAAALGSRVRPAPRREIGWHPVTLTAAASHDPLWAGAASPFTAFHWHGDVFDLPRGAVRIAASQHTECQAFRHGRNAWGFLFHLEVTSAGVAEMVESFPEDLRTDKIGGRSVLGRAAAHLPGMHRLGREVFRRWAGQTGATRRT
jgi:GMP synthase (glutamine-hydrolysing)